LTLKILLKIYERTKKMLKPNGDRVLIELIEQESRTPSGLHIPEGARKKEQYQRGTVVAVGEGKYTGKLVILDDLRGVAERIPVPFSLGDLVLLAPQASQYCIFLNVNGKPHALINADDILGTEV
jgi:chaperonin GroES